MFADRARGRLRAKLPALRHALTGRFRGHHAFLVSQLLAHLEDLEASMATRSAASEAQLAPFADAVARLRTIPGVEQRTAEILGAEIGANRPRFPSAGHLGSWAGLCPGNNESAGKRTRGTTRKGCQWLRSGLIEAALVEIRKRDCALGARYRRVMRHRGHKKAIVAVAHPIRQIANDLLACGTTYQEFGAAYFDRRDQERAARRYVCLLEQLGHRVTLEPIALAA